MTGRSTLGDDGLPIMTWTPVARASSSSGWLASGSITTMLPGRNVCASRCSTGIVMLSSPVRMVASRTSRARIRSTGWRHTTVATVSAPVSVAPRQTGPPTWYASGSGTLQAPKGKDGGLPTYMSSTQPATAPGVCPARHVASDAEVRTPPISTIATTVVMPTTCGVSRRGYQ